MKNWNRFATITLLMIFTITPSLGFAEAEFDEIYREYIEGKIQAAEQDQIQLCKEIEQKQQTASNLMAQINSKLNDRYSVNDEREKEETEYALIGFISRLQSIHKEKELLEMKEIRPELKTLQEFNKRLDSLITDLKSFLK